MATDPGAAFGRHPVFLQYDERLVRLNATASTLRNYRRAWQLFEESGLDPLTVQDFEIEEWLAALEHAPRTKRLHLECLSAAYNYAVRRGVLHTSPTETVRLPREPDKEPRILDTPELRSVLANTTTDSAERLVMLLMYTGMRRMEVLNLRWEDISGDTITVMQGKGGKLRHVPLHPALGGVLERTRTEGYVFPAAHGKAGPTSQSALVALLRGARGDVDCSFHDFRRTVATSLAENEVPEGIIDRIMGWAPRTVGRRYYIRRADGRMQEAILRLYADDPVHAPA